MSEERPENIKKPLYFEKRVEEGTLRSLLLSLGVCLVINLGQVVDI